MTKKLAFWIFITSISVFLGKYFAKIFMGGWYIFSAIILGHGDSGPYWVNSITFEVMPKLGYLSSIILGQLIFYLLFIRIKKPEGPNSSY